MTSESAVQSWEDIALKRADYQPILAHKLLDCLPDRIAAHPVLVRQLPRLALDEGTEAGQRLGQSPLFEHVERTPGRRARNPVLLADLVNRRHLIAWL
jgi:hypothetical protein